ncbi:hypothetical protein K1W54_32390 [Micromonospora sp. CPCC 205371]|nr:hypothetical protein [Micromonospora sp. CPCC 205371]
MKALVLNFAPLPAAHRQTVKQLCLAMLSGELPIGETRPKVSSIRRHMVELKRFVCWLDANVHGRPLVDLTAYHLAAYGRHLHTVIRSAATREVAEVAVRLFWRYRSVLPDDHLAIDPLDVDGWGHSTRRRLGSENTTPRIPEDVMGALLVWSLRFIDNFANDITASSARWHARRSQPTRSRIHPHEVQARLHEVLRHYVDDGRPLPGHRGGVNVEYLAREVGCGRNTLRLPHHAATIQATARIIGVAPFTDMGTPVTGQLDGDAWLTRIASDPADPHSAASLTRQLQAACYITIAYLSGMRDSEIKHLQRGCTRPHRDSDGAVYRWTITGRAFKGEADPAGTPATWVIGAAVARAIAVLEQLQPIGVDTLFRTLPHATTAAPRDAMNNARTNELLNAFVAWVNAYCRQYGRHDPVPEVAGRPWKLSTGQFRRTLAWHIARRAGGAIAGAIQYRHLSIQMFEGYAGTSESAQGRGLPTGTSRFSRSFDMWTREQRQPPGNLSRSRGRPWIRAASSGSIGSRTRAGRGCAIAGRPSPRRYACSV